jgi:hypothetical protein
MIGFKCIAGMVCALAAGVAAASPIAVGSGGKAAEVYINFKDGAAYDFDVSFDGSTTGLGLFDIIESQTSLTTIRKTFGIGQYIDGIGFAGHSNAGYGGGSDYWHYWVRDSEQSAWASSNVGASDRVVNDGIEDGWVYGSSASPVPEPGVMGILCVVGGMTAWRRSVRR